MSSARTTRLRRSATFRLALLYAVVFGASILVVLGFVYWSTAAYMSRQADQTIEAEIGSFEERYRTSGLAGLTALIRERLSRRPAGSSIYLLVAPDRTPVIGNLRSWPRVEPDREGWLVFRLEDATVRGDPQIHGARARSFRIRGGYQLLVGRDMHELESIQRLIRQATVSGLLIAALLALVGAVVTSRSMLRRLGTINATVDDIMTGDLSRRIPDDGAGDEFSQLVDHLNRMLERIEALLEGVKQVSDNIAHDLRTPLARLRNRLDELDQDGDRQDRQEVVESAIREADGLLATFGALLRIARIESGARRSGFESVDLASLAREVGELYEPVAESRGQTLSLQTPDQLVVQGDPELLSQALANLTDNALKYTPEGGAIEISVQSDAGAPRVTVADTGPGIPEDERGSVFQRFYRLDTSRGSPGSGLGLSLVGAVAKLHEIQVRLEDGRPGLRVSLEWPPSGGGQATSRPLSSSGSAPARPSGGPP
jgi:signal transduction histidine kinase